MKITDLKINGLRQPLGFELPYLCVSWKVKDTVSQRARKSRLSVAADADFTQLIAQREDADLRSIGEVIDVSLQRRTRYYVRVEVLGDAGDSATADTFFETGKMDEAFSASWIGMQPEDQFHPVFLRRFSLLEAPVSARLYISGLGLYEAYLNGEKAGDELLAPFCNDYNLAVQVQTYDVTKALRMGENCLEILCGKGWYMGRLGFSGAQGLYGDRFQALAELRLVFADGSERVLGTDIVKL